MTYTLFIKQAAVATVFALMFGVVPNVVLAYYDDYDVIDVYYEEYDVIDVYYDDYIVYDDYVVYDGYDVYYDDYVYYTTGATYTSNGPIYTNGARYNSRGARYTSSGAIYNSNGARYNSRGAAYDTNGATYDTTGATFDSNGATYDSNGAIFSGAGHTYEQGTGYTTDAPDCTGSQCDYAEAVCEDFDVSDDSVEKGDYVTLRWETEGGKVSISPDVGSVSANGSKRVKVHRDTTFTLRVANKYDADNCFVTVEVSDDNDDTDDGNDGNAGHTYSSGSSDGGWSMGTTNVYTSDGHTYTTSGNVYTMSGSIYGDETSNNDITVTEVRTGGQAAGVSLSDAPYTGVDATDAVQWTLYGLVLLWALYGAYFVAVRQAPVAV